MALRYDDGLINELVSAFEVFEGGELEIYTGSQPASANDAPTGTLLATIALPVDAFGAASGGVLSKNGTWNDTVDATGTAGWARMKDSGGTINMDMAVTATGGGGEIELDSTSLVAGGIVTVSTFTITQPAS